MKIKPKTVLKNNMRKIKADINLIEKENIQ